MTFLFNGGPGASSAWLQLGAAGPWRISLAGDGAVSSAPPELLPNAETWLDFTDLAFIDSVGTGYSRFVAQRRGVRKRLFSVDGDVNAIALVIRRWLEKYDACRRRNSSPAKAMAASADRKWCATCRPDKASAREASILVSPLLDFRDDGLEFVQYVASLPTMAAVAREAKGARYSAMTSPTSSVTRAAISCSIFSEDRRTPRPPRGWPTRSRA